MKKLSLIILAALLALSLSFGAPSEVSAKTSSTNQKHYGVYTKKNNSKKNTKNSYTGKKSTTKKSSGSSYKKSTSKKSSKKSSKCVEWPDCDDYWDEDEFLDDWDGNMPDGSDAMDYWDNW